MPDRVVPSSCGPSSATPWSSGQSRSPGPGTHLCSRGTSLPALLPVAGMLEHVLSALKPPSRRPCSRSRPLPTPRGGRPRPRPHSPPESALPSEALRPRVVRWWGPRPNPRPGPDSASAGVPGAVATAPQVFTHGGSWLRAGVGASGGCHVPPRPPWVTLRSWAGASSGGLPRGHGAGGDSWAQPQDGRTGPGEVLCPTWRGGGGDAAPWLHWPELRPCERTLAVGEALCLGGTPEGWGGGRGQHWEATGRWSWGGGRGVSPDRLCCRRGG